MLYFSILNRIDKASLESIIKEKERLIGTLTRQVSQTTEELNSKERDFRETLQRMTDEARHSSSSGRTEIQALKDRNSDLEQKLAKIEFKTSKEIEHLEKANDNYEK